MEVGGWGAYYRKYTIAILVRVILFKKEVASQQEIHNNNNIGFTLKTSQLGPVFKAFCRTKNKKLAFRDILVWTISSNS